MPPTTEVLGLLAGSEERQVQLVLLPDVHPLDVTDETWAELSVPAHALKDQSLPTLAALQASFSQKVLALLLLLLVPLLFAGAPAFGPAPAPAFDAVAPAFAFFAAAAFGSFQSSGGHAGAGTGGLAKAGVAELEDAGSPPPVVASSSSSSGV